jgi:hypothetical protein
MSADDLQGLCVAQIRLRSYDERYIDENDEREILEIIGQQGAAPDSARNTLFEVCDRHNYVLESRVLADLKDRIATAKIDEKEFNDAVASSKKRLRGKKDEMQVRRLVVEIIEENGFKVRTGMFWNWYAKVKKEVGLG